MTKLNRTSLIVANCIVSESEIQKVIPDFPDNYDESKLKTILFELGMDILNPIELQENFIHRNRLNEVVKCNRWFGDERQDSAWINSGYASREATDKYSGNKLIEDHYRMKMQTVDTQQMLEERDRYAVIDESEWE